MPTFSGSPYTAVDILGTMSDATLVASSGTEVTYQLNSATYRFEGTGFAVSGGALTAGTITDVEVTVTNVVNGVPVTFTFLTMTGLSIAATDFEAALAAERSDSDPAALESLIGALSYTVSGTSDDDTFLSYTNGEGIPLTLTAANSWTLMDGNDAAQGGTVTDVMDGGTGNDSLYGGGGNDTLFGGSGNDRLDGGTGVDRLEGADGNDLYVVDNALDTVADTTGLDQVNASIDYRLGSGLETLVLLGSANLTGTGNTLANRLTGTTGANSLYGGGGNDTLLGGAGNDRLDGGTGADRLQGGDGDDLFIVDDVLDTVLETSGLDQVNASVDHRLASGVETLVLQGSADLSGTGNSLANRITGNTGANSLYGGGAADTLLGGLGDDRLDGGAGADRLQGGDGDDLYIVDNALDAVIETSGLDQVNATVRHTLASGVENLVLQGSANIAGTGNSLDNRITGNGGANALAGGGGDDTLLGGAGNDRLDGGTGADRLQGGDGDDLYIVDDALDTVLETSGLDQVNAFVSHRLASGVETLALQGSADLTGTGNALANRITGTTGANTLYGGGDDDTLLGGAGNDRLFGDAGGDRLQGGAGNDAFVFTAPDEGPDTVVDFSRGASNDDRFQISAAGFGGGLAAGGSIAGSEFRARADNVAQDADDRFIFRTTDETLWYDSNGKAAGGLHLVADLQAGATLTAGDIFIIA